MLELRNRTPYAAALVPGLDKEGRQFVTAVVKATYSLDGARSLDAPLPLSDDPVPIVWADAYRDEPDNSSIVYASDVGPARSGTDVALIGHAIAPPGGATQVDVRLDAGPLGKTVRVFGDRRWRKRAGIATKSRPERFDRMPLVYERAFGGADVSHKKPSKHGYEARNPVGVGFTTKGRGDHFDALALPNLEDPAHLIGRPGHKPPPAGFGFISPGWEPRSLFVGTYDQAWLENRAPLLPHDFDARHFRSAHPDLCSPRPFAGGEPVRVVNASSRGELLFKVPGVRFEVKAEVKGQEQIVDAHLDALVIEPDASRVTACWKATVACPGMVPLVTYVRVRELERFA